MALSFVIKTFVVCCLLFHQSLGDLDESNRTLASFNRNTFLNDAMKAQEALFHSQLALLMKMAEMESDSKIESRLEQLEKTTNLTLDLLIEARTKERGQGKCKEGWIYFSGSCYLFSFAHGSWDEGRQDCLDLGSDYVKITTLEEFNFCLGHIKGNSWIGLNDLGTEGNYTWSSDGSEDKNSRKTWWHEDEPDSYYSTQDCVAFWFTEDKMLWNDKRCYWKFNYICEMQPIA